MAMRFRMTMLAMAVVVVLGVGSLAGFAQQDTVTGKIGQKLSEAGQVIKNEARTVTESVAKEFDKVRTDVNRMELHNRVYSRIHWDKALHDSKINVHMFKGGVVLLRGTVPDSEAKKRAVALATETMDVTEVIDDLTPLVKSEPKPKVAAPGGGVR
jgi:hyperosmotically inducible protein